MGIAKVHKILTLQRIFLRNVSPNGRKDKYVEKRKKYSCSGLVWWCYGETKEELVYCLISIILEALHFTSAKPPPPYCHVLIMLRDHHVSSLLLNKNLKDYFSGIT